jgi:hypothetical protein
LGAGDPGAFSRPVATRAVGVPLVTHHAYMLPDAKSTCAQTQLPAAILAGPEGWYAHDDGIVA